HAAYLPLCWRRREIPRACEVRRLASSDGSLHAGDAAPTDHLPSSPPSAAPLALCDWLGTESDRVVGAGRRPVVCGGGCRCGVAGSWRDKIRHARPPHGGRLPPHPVGWAAVDDRRRAASLAQPFAEPGSIDREEGSAPIDELRSSNRGAL